MMGDVICMVCLAWAIAQVETGGDPEAVGAAGERTVYQFAQDTWADYSTVPMEVADPEEVERVFVAHATWVAGRAAVLEGEVTVETVALIWNAGYGRVRDGRAPAAAVDYAERVGNLYRWRQGAKENNRLER